MDSVREQVARLFITRLDLDDTDTAYRAGEEFIRRDGIRSFIIFGGRAIETARVLRKLQGLTDGPLLFCSDMERGAGQQWPDATSFPYFRGFGDLARRLESTEAIRRSAEITAIEAGACGIHVNFSPTVDIDNNPANPIISIRSFGETPAHVIDCAGAYLKGLADGGMLGVVKHFPGHGDTEIDSHEALPELNFDKKRLESTELLPFRRITQTFPEIGIMIGHLAAPALDESGIPASLSPRMITGLLRGAWSFNGPVFTDALMMGAVAKSFPHAALEAFLAGADFLLMPEKMVPAIEDVVAKVQTDSGAANRLTDALKRIGWLTRRLCRPIDLKKAEELVGSKAHRDEAKSVAQAVCHFKKGTWPDDPGSCHILVVESEKGSLAGVLPAGANATYGLLANDPPGLPHFDCLVLVTDVRPAAWRNIHKLPEKWMRVIDKMLAEKDHLVISTGSDRLDHELTNLKNYFCTYGRSSEALDEIRRLLKSFV